MEKESEKEKEKEKEKEPKYGSPEWYAWLQAQADPVNASLYY